MAIGLNFLCLFCSFLQGPETDQATVSKIRDAIREQREITVQLINYTKSGKKLRTIIRVVMPQICYKIQMPVNSNYFH